MQELKGTIFNSATAGQNKHEAQHILQCAINSKKLLQRSKVKNQKGMDTNSWKITMTAGNSCLNITSESESS